MRNYVQRRVMWQSSIYDEPPATATATAPATATATAPATATTTAPASANGKTFTQEEVNAMIAKSRNEDKERNKKLLTQLESLKSTVGMTTQEKETLQKQIEELKTSSMTKEELAARERKKLETRLTSELETVQGEAKQWRTRYENSTRARALMDASVEAKAFNPQQLVDMLSPRTKVVEVLEDGKGTGKFEVQVSFDDVDKDGKPINLTLSPTEVVKRMKELPDKYGNLFASGAKGGMGFNPGGNADGKIDYKNITPEQYAEMRKKNKRKRI